MRIRANTSALILAFAIAAVAPATVACGGSSASAPAAGGDDWEAETSTGEDGVTTVRTVAGSVWGGPARLVESISIGVDQGALPYMLGRVTGVSASDERIYVLDSSVPVLRVYDRQGAHVMDIGQDGEGPGEFRQPDALVVAPDGRIFVRDARQGRITVFDADGSFVETRPLEQGFIIMGAGNGMVLTDDGKVYTPGRAGPRPESRGPGVMRMRMAMIPRGVDGTDGEPIPQPEFDYEPPRIVQESRRGGNVMVRAQGVPFAAQIVWALAPSGAMLAGVPTDYAFEIRYGDGSTTRVEKAWEPVAVAPAEAGWHKEQVTASMRQSDPEWVWDAGEIAATKPAYQALSPDRAGRVWVTRPGPGVQDPACERDPDTGTWDPPCWRDSSIYEVFDLEGRFLGSVDAPDDFRLVGLSFIDDDEVFTTVEDEVGVLTVRGYRIETPS